jgi:diadenosine tetraphosphatase ApaH/serine/threonine PP2A family protein phosphatase
LRIGIVTDIHANLAAFETVLAQLKAQKATERLWCLGDVVGYGPFPNECLDLLREYEHICLPGNHDWGAIGRADPNLFNSDARFVLEWTAERLTPDNRAYLEALPEIVHMPDVPFTLVHASPRDHIWEYLLEPQEAAECFPFFETSYCLVGHTHVPAVFRQSPEDGTVKMILPEPNEMVRLSSPRLILNPGSVGQPRDHDPRAHYAIYDTDEHTLQFCRVDYPIAVTQGAMQALDFPRRLIARLDYGF